MLLDGPGDGHGDEVRAAIVAVKHSQSLVDNACRDLVVVLIGLAGIRSLGLGQVLRCDGVKRKDLHDFIGSVFNGRNPELFSFSETNFMAAAALAKTLTGNKAGVTRGQQWVRVTPYLEVLDTPGTLYPKLDDRTVALDLAFIGSIRDEVLDMYGLAAELVKRLAPSGAIERRYGVVPSADEHETLTDIARARGFLVKGGETDDERAAYAVIDDFRKGRMGKIILEKA